MHFLLITLGVAMIGYGISLPFGRHGSSNSTMRVLSLGRWKPQFGSDADNRRAVINAVIVSGLGLLFIVAGIAKLGL